jgi:hypothetical protein
MNGMRTASFFGVAASAVVTVAGLARADLVGVNYTTGGVFLISTANGSAKRVGETTTGVMGLDRDASGRLLAVTDGIAGKLAIVDEQSWELDAVGTLNAGFTFEGGLAVGSGGRTFGGSRLSGSGRAIFQIDSSSGGMSQSITLSRETVDLNGLQFRDDGVLMAIDALGGDLVSVDIETGEVATIAQLITPRAGAVGGLAIENGVGYYVTAGTASGSNGDNSLYQIDLYTGEQWLIGALGPEAGSGFGIGAIAGHVVPSPAAVLLLAGAGVLSAGRRRRRDSDFGPRGSR